MSEPSAVGRRISNWRRGARREGVVIKHEPVTHALNDALVDYGDGDECWTSLHACKPVDGLGPLPDRQAAIREAEEEHRASLRKILRDHVAAHVRGERWKGCDFGRAIIGNAILEAMKSIGLDPKVELDAALSDSLKIPR